jgi:hypothetical protein
MLETVATPTTSQALVPVSQTRPQALMSITVPNLAQPQREAIVDLLLLGIYADRHIAASEQDFLAMAIDRMGWDELQSPEIYLQRAMPIAREILTGSADRVQAFLQAVGDRLSEVETMKYAIEQFSALIALDGITSEAEAALFDQVMEGFFAAA